MGTIYQSQLPFSRRKFWLFLLVLALLTDSVPGRRGGGGLGRGSSGAARSSGGSRGSSGGGFFGGLFGGSSSSKHSSSSNTGGSASKPRSSGSYGSSSSGATTWNREDRKKFREPMYTKGSGIGSRFRSDTFKNMVVGAAAGYLTYQAGKAIIRSAMGPMMWNNRPYYWGSNYYRPQYPNQPMCRMPLQAGDPQFGNIYFQDQTRPREIVWGCSYNEHCCGYECCPGAGYDHGGYYGGSGRSFGQMFSLGSIIVLLMFCLCGGFIIHQICKARNNSGRIPWFGSNKYKAGQQAENEPPPHYTTSGATFTYPPAPTA